MAKSGQYVVDGFNYFEGFNQDFTLGRCGILFRFGDRVNRNYYSKYSSSPALPTSLLPLFQRPQILLPLHREQIFFLCVALLARWDDIALSRFSSAGDRYQMIRGQVCWLELSSAVIADPARSLSLPPLRIPQFSGLRFFPFNMSIIGSDKKIVLHFLIILFPIKIVTKKRYLSISITHHVTSQKLIFFLTIKPLKDILLPASGVEWEVVGLGEVRACSGAVLNIRWM